jgi:hypothetical protein
MRKLAAPAATVIMLGFSRVKPSAYFKLSANTISKQLAIKRYVHAISLPLLCLYTVDVKTIVVITNI